ncbi:MAG: fumarate hydrolyase [Nitrospirae bacterium]|nr:fumarate hydrolyase [Nitrospirota bacterium]
MIKILKTPISDEDILSLHIGDIVELYGIGVTSRDMAHKYMVERLIERQEPLSEEDQRIYEELKSILNGGFIYHCGPIVRFKDGKWRFVSSGPTTSIRTEIYQHRVIEAFNVKVIIGKGGMGDLTLDACKRNKTIYLHGIGGAGVLNAEAVVEVQDVFKKDEFGLPEAIWKIRVERLTGIVTMDAHGRSLHKISLREVKEKLKTLYS